MYAITFDLKVADLEQHYSTTSPNNAYAEIYKILEEEGFMRMQGSVYFGNRETVNAVTCVLTVRRLSVELSWFALCVRDIRMLRIEEANDLMPAVHAS